MSSRVYRKPEDLCAAEAEYDGFVTGSDQIWNPDIFAEVKQGQDYAYMLDFVKNKQKKHSYAASMGVSVLSEEKKAEFRKWLSDFSVLTVREHRAAVLLQELLEREIPSVCDPVLLLTPEDWVQIEKAACLRDMNYILVYSVGGGKELLPYAEELAAREGCAVYVIQPPVVATVTDDREKMLTGVGPAQFVWLIRHARAVVTTSFHGTAFSLLFRKPVHLVREPAAKKGNRNSRFDSLFRYFALEEKQRCVVDIADRQVEIVTPDSRNLEALERVKVKSVDLLDQVIN